MASAGTIAKIAQFEMAPHGRFRSVPKDRAVPIERLPEACFLKARPVDGAVLERGFRSGIPRLYRPGKHHEAVVGLNPGQTRLVKGMDALSHWTPLFRAYPERVERPGAAWFQEVVQAIMGSERCGPPATRRQHSRAGLRYETD
jgi:hypothetical protein